MSPPENTKQITLSRIKSGPLNYVVPIIQYFSSNPHPPHKVRLCSVGISHYVEKVRWGFTLSGIDYIEDAHTPGLASIATTGIDAETSATPIIKTENGQVVKVRTAELTSELTATIANQITANQITAISPNSCRTPR